MVFSKIFIFARMLDSGPQSIPLLVSPEGDLLYGERGLVVSDPAGGASLHLLRLLRGAAAAKTSFQAASQATTCKNILQ